jgi:hypothetical protein
VRRFRLVLASLALIVGVAMPVAVTTVANAAPATCSATIGGTVTSGNAGNFNAVATYDNCTTWRAYVTCLRNNTAGPVTYRYGSWRSTVGVHSIAGCFNGSFPPHGGVEYSTGQYFGRF